MSVGSSFHELRYRRAWIIGTAARRISFDETRCQGKPANQPSMNVPISAMLGRSTRRRCFQINQAER